MKKTRHIDVLVAGGGPGGSLAAKRCAEMGLETLLMERRRTPRDKVCTGMIMAPWCQGLVASEFGPFPDNVLVAPRYLSGHRIHVSGAAPVVLKEETPIGWRRDLDAWMNDKAGESGAEFQDRTALISFEKQGDSYKILARRDSEDLTLQSRFVIGADGAGSRVRKTLFPGYRVKYSVPMRECYEGRLDMERDEMHWFFPKGLPRPRFDVIHKGDCFVLEGSGIKVLREEIPQILAPYGFHDQMKPLWKDGCMVALLHENLVSGNFSPAQGNSLLVGDAAGLILPVTFEGIGTALKSGSLAADAVFEASQSGKDAAGIYLVSLRPLIKKIRQLHLLGTELKEEAARGSEALSKALKAAYEAAMLE